MPVAWEVDYSEAARRALRKLDRPTEQRIRAFVDSLPELPNPRARGEALKGPFAEFWRYRVGDYRLICRIQDDLLVVLVVKIAHRSEVYRTR